MSPGQTVKEYRDQRERIVKSLTFREIVTALDHWNAKCIYAGNDGHEASLLVESAIDKLHSVKAKYNPRG